MIINTTDSTYIYGTNADASNNLMTSSEIAIYINLNVAKNMKYNISALKHLIMFVEAKLQDLIQMRFIHLFQFKE